MKQFSNTPLETAIKAVYCKNMGVEPHVVSGSRTVNTADSRNHLQTHCIWGLQGRCKPGVTYYTFPPLQALFISGVETGEGRKSNDLIVRRSSMKDNCVQLPPCADSGAARPSQATIALIRKFHYLYLKDAERYSRYLHFSPSQKIENEILRHPRESAHIALKAICDQLTLWGWYAKIPDFPKKHEAFFPFMRNLWWEYGSPECRRYTFKYFLPEVGIPRQAAKSLKRAARETLCKHPFGALLCLAWKGKLTPDGVFLFDDISPEVRNAVREFLIFELANPVESDHE